MPKSMTENAFLSSINNNLTRRGDAVHADLWIGKKIAQQLSLKINKNSKEWNSIYTYFILSNAFWSDALYEIDFKSI